MSARRYRLNPALSSDGGGGWLDVSEMRSQIRQDRASEPKSSHGPISVSITTELRRLSQRLGELLESNPLDKWDSGQLEGFLSDAEPFLKVARSVKARFAELNPDLSIQADQWVSPKRSKIRTELFYPYFKYTKMKTSELSGSRFSRWRRSNPRFSETTEVHRSSATPNSMQKPQPKKDKK